MEGKNKTKTNKTVVAWYSSIHKKEHPTNVYIYLYVYIFKAMLLKRKTRESI